MFKNAKREDYVKIVSEIGLTVSTEKLNMYDISGLIKSSNQYKEDPQLVEDIANEIIETRKNEASELLNIEKIKLQRTQAEIELAKLRTESQTESKIESDRKDNEESLDALIKSIKILTVRIPQKPEGWNYFFASLERAFISKNVPEKYKAEVLLNLLGEKATNILTYIKDNELNDYMKLKELVLREYQPSPQVCLEHFKKAQKQSNETYVQFASRLTASWKFYLKLRKVEDFEMLNKLIVSDKIFQTLEKETASHIAIRQADSWFEPLKLSQEIDLYLLSKGKQTENYYTSRKNTYSKHSAKVFYTDTKNNPKECFYCKQSSHNLYQCSNYKKLSVNERLEVVKKNNLCFLCLSASHKFSQCKSNYKCKNCFKRHSLSLCYSQEKNEKEKLENQELSEVRNSFVSDQKLSPSASAFIPLTSSESSASNLFTMRSNHSCVLLSTAICFVKDELGNKHKLRIILDSGSSSNLILCSVAEKIGLNKQRTNRILTGLNDASMSVRFKANAEIKNAANDFVSQVEFLIVPHITESLIPSQYLNVNKQELNKIILADERFNVPGKIDALLGAELFYQILLPGQLYPLNTNLILQNSVFGYIVSGNVPTSNVNKIHCTLIKDNLNLDDLLRNFWELENIESEVIKNKESIICEEHFLKSYSRDEKGKYIVKMPLKREPNCLGKSKEIAVRRLNNLYARMSKNHEFFELYKQFLNEYRELGHMVEVENNEDEGMYFIPHLGVYRPESDTTPLRVVFDASCPTTSGISLNDLQYNGGVPQDDLFSIMVRFRKYIFAFTADVRKMYRMIWIHPDQRNLQRIVWREGINEPIKTFELTTVTYGTTSAPYLATRTLKQLALDEANYFPLAAEIVSRDMYMDDILSGAETISEAIELQRQLIEIFEKAGMTLHKFCSNDEQLIRGKEENYKFASSAETKALGVFWNQSNDNFTFNIKTDTKSSHTKRDVLSTIARLFDPLGLLGPVITRAKIMLQQLWLLKLNWVDLLPPTEEREWKNYTESLKQLNSLSIERCILIVTPDLIELHGFCDASELAYGAVVYCKSTCQGDIKIQLIASKSRVSPLKKLTIPRLELCGAVLLARLITKVKSALHMKPNSVWLWSDSMIVLSWIRKESHQLKLFVANRVAKIQELTEVSQWHHVASELNSADLVSRGLSPQDLLQCDLWWNGPGFLRDTDYPCKHVPETVIQDNNLPELKKSDYVSEIFHVELNSFMNDLLTISNSYIKLIRVISFIFRFIENCKGRNLKTGSLGPEELKYSELVLVRLVQKECFAKEIQELGKHSKSMSKLNNMSSLNPFLDRENVLRVGGRLSNSDLGFNSKFPILLPAKHPFTTLIVSYFHKKYLHSGPQALLYQIRQQFWIINGRSICRKVVHDCVTCFKAKPQMLEQIMGDLPEERVRKMFPFNITGADFCGPFYIKYKGQRKGIYHKVYVCIFICFVSKAIHLEVVSDMTSAAFIAALKRFIFRRGKCSKLFSDNAKNFVGANAELKKLHKLVCQPDEVLANYMSTEGIDWKFLPPRAPNFGGLWEAGVKSIKYYLKRVVGNSKLTYEEFQTILIQVEGMLNSRPLVPLSTDIEDLNVLTPSHFLIGRPITSIVEPDLTNIGENRLDHWQKLIKITQIIWKRWSSDYLSNQQQRSKWKFEKDNVKVGDMVIIKEDNLPPCQWSLGRICGSKKV